MAKQSPAKTKKLAAEAKRAGAAHRAEKKAQKESHQSNSAEVLDAYEAVDGAWRDWLTRPSEAGLDR